MDNLSISGLFRAISHPQRTKVDLPNLAKWKLNQCCTRIWNTTPSIHLKKSEPWHLSKFWLDEYLQRCLPFASVQFAGKYESVTQLSRNHRLFGHHWQNRTVPWKKNRTSHSKTAWIISWDSSFKSVSVTSAEFRFFMEDTRTMPSTLPFNPSNSLEDKFLF